MGAEKSEARQHGVTSLESPGEGEESLEPSIPRIQPEGGLQVKPRPSADDISLSQSTTAAGSSVTTAVRFSNDAFQPCDVHLAHTVEPEALARALGVSVDAGLSAAEAADRLARDGPNKVNEAKAASPWEIFLRQISNSLTVVLLITMVVSFVIDDYIEGAVISAVILLNIVIGFFQDYRAEQQILSLQALSAPVSKVLREGKVQNLKAEHLVVGDIVQLTVGDVVPADVRLISGVNASTDEALLTGESLPVSKDHGAVLQDPSVPIGDRINMCYSGTTMTRGRAMGIVTATGMSTEVGKIAALLRQKRGRKDGRNIVVRILVSIRDGVRSILGLIGTPLQVKLSKFALLLFALAILLAIIVFSANKWDVEGEVLIYGICVAVAVIPESLIAVLTITVAVGTKAMAKGNVIVRRLAALEAVGGVNHICSDKTGTLTQGKMIARRLWIPQIANFVVIDSNNPLDPTSGRVEAEDESGLAPSAIPSSSAVMEFLHAVALCNNSTVYEPKANLSVDTLTATDTPNTWSAIGEPTEVALQIFAMRFNKGKTRLLSDSPQDLVTEFGFDSAIKRMTVVYKHIESGTITAYTKGATEAIVPLLSVTDAERSEILAKADVMAAEGLRVLCVAARKIDSTASHVWASRSSTEDQLSFCGLIGLYDPPRVETATSVRDCQRAGITVHMLTGDHIRTATAIAIEVGIIPQHLSEEQLQTVVMKAEQFDKLSDMEVDNLAELPLVIARCSPATKVRMVDALHRRRAFCVMTGDGVNDSPSLKRADVGIAMGLNGSDVAKDAADMILTDDNFASIVKAVREGRRLFDNIQKFLMHLLISNISQVILLLVGLAFQDDEDVSIFPLSPLEILWVNLITSSFLAIGLGLEEASPDIMLRKPHNLRVGVFTRELIVDKFIYGAFMGSLCLVSFVIVAYGANDGRLGSGCNSGYNETCDVTFRARATTWATLTNLLLVTAWEVKHFTRSLFALDPERHSGPFAIFPTLWKNRFLFYAVVAGFVIAFPVIYLPVINHEVFRHQGISWEWGVVFGNLVVYICLVESWKAIKRRFKIGSAAALIQDDVGDEKSAV